MSMAEDHPGMHEIDQYLLTLSVGPAHLHVVVGNVVGFQTDVVVNAANPTLTAGRGVDGCFTTAGGDGLRNARKRSPTSPYLEQG